MLFSELTPEQVATTPLREIFKPHWYPSVRKNAPSLLILRRPKDMITVRPGCPVVTSDLFKVVIIENEHERRFAEKCLDSPLPMIGNVVQFRTTIDRPMMSTSTLRQSKDLLVLFYEPTEDGWPFITLMSSNFANGPGAFRGRYIYFLFDSPDGQEDHIYQMGAMTAAYGLPTKILA